MWRPPETTLKLNGRNFPFVNSIKYVGVISDIEKTANVKIILKDVK
jgi:hypothetical protein